MKTIKTPAEMKKALEDRSDIGLVPTMGAIHDGHMSLVKMSQQKNEITVVSVFLNATQFNNPKDLASYPSSIEEDLKHLEDAGVDYVFLPEYSDIYPDNFKYFVDESELSQDLCGSDRPGHFKGVLSVVMKLFNIVKPSHAYFGEKDYQQYKLIQGMADAFFMDVEVVPGAIVRDNEGLALSSRNRRLDQEGLKKAHFFAKALHEGREIEEIKAKLQSKQIEIDYLKDIDERRYAAVKINDVRLIDNVEI